MTYKVIASFSDAETFWCTESVWKPDLQFEFPASKESSEKVWTDHQEVKQTRMFIVMADHATEVSNKETLSLVLRYDDSSMNSREEFADSFRLGGEETTSVSQIYFIIVQIFSGGN